MKRTLLFFCSVLTLLCACQKGPDPLDPDRGEELAFRLDGRSLASVERTVASPVPRLGNRTPIPQPWLAPFPVGQAVPGGLFLVVKFSGHGDSDHGHAYRYDGSITGENPVLLTPDMRGYRDLMDDATQVSPFQVGIRGRVGSGADKFRMSILPGDLLKVCFQLIREAGARPVEVSVSVPANPGQVATQVDRDGMHFRMWLEPEGAATLAPWP